MDSSQALDHYASRRDLLSGFLSEYALLTDERPELTNLLTFDAYVHFCFSFYATLERSGSLERLLTELGHVRARLPFPDPDNLRPG